MVCVRSFLTLVFTIALSWSLPTLAHGLQATPPGKNAAAASAVLQSNFTSPDVTVTILKGKPKRLLLAHVYAETVGNTVEGTYLQIRVFANGVQMEPGEPTRPFHATKCTIGQIKPPPVLELDASCIAYSREGGSLTGVHRPGERRNSPQRRTFATWAPFGQLRTRSRRG